MNILVFIIAAALVAAVNVSHSAPSKEQRYQLSIESGTLVSVLEQLSEQTGLQIGTEINVANSQTTHVGPFSGHATADEAIGQLLTGTDLWYAWRKEDTIRLFQISTQRTNWTTGVITAKEASASIRSLAGVHYETSSCGGLMVGPLSTWEPISAEAFWVELIKPHCPVIRRPSTNIQPRSIDRQTLAGRTQHTFDFEQMSRDLALRRISQQTGVMVRYTSTDVAEESALVGPIAGQMTLNDALSRAVRGSLLRIRWVDDGSVNIEPAYRMVAFADMSICPCNFGLPEWRPLLSEQVTVTKQRLPGLEDSSPAPVVSFDRSYIEATGASTIPELLSYLAQQVFTRSPEYRPNAAQHFEGRGFGAQYSLVLIDGHRAYGNASDPLTNAFDLNVVPLHAVERVDIALDHPSVRYGTDAIGGTVNIVLRRDLQERATIRVGSARGGAEKRWGALHADTQWQRNKAGFVLDYLAQSDLLGSQRDRWRNQDYTRYSTGLDYRLPLGTPPNVHSVAGNLPGTSASSAAIVFEPDGLALRPDVANMESALAHAAILPEQERLNLYGFSNAMLGSTELRLAVLFGRQTASLQLFPVNVPGLIWGAQHAQNPFDVDVVIETLLTGLPPRRQEVESTTVRVMADWSGSVGRWGLSTFLVAQEDRSRAWVSNEIDLPVLADSLTTDDPRSSLNVLSDRPGEGPLPHGLFLPRSINSYSTGAVQFGIDLSGELLTWRSGQVHADIGLAHRQETVDFDADLGPLKRDITSLFSRVRIPIVSASSSSVLRGLDFTLGGRRDFHSDVRDITTFQCSLEWQPLRAIQVHAAYSELFRPPSLSERYLPRLSFPTEVYDPLRNEVAVVNFVTGGNPSLHPTKGQSLNLGVSIHSAHGWKAALNYWETQMRNRVSAVLIQDLVRARADDVQGRLVRSERTGRLLSLDTTRADFGAIGARGIDFSWQREIPTPIGRITPSIEMTRTVDFSYRDLPAASAPMLDRAGVASPYGTVPSGRAVMSLKLEIGWLQVSAFARHHTSYRDYSPFDGTPTDRRIPEQTLLDITFTGSIGDHLTLSVGARNVLDNQPPFAQSGGWVGFDQSQGDLVGRDAFLIISGSM
jgi:iron complex outermembrane receptor protein